LPVSEPTMTCHCPCTLTSAPFKTAPRLADASAQAEAHC